MKHPMKWRWNLHANEYQEECSWIESRQNGNRRGWKLELLAKERKKRNHNQVVFLSVLLCWFLFSSTFFLIWKQNPTRYKFKRRKERKQENKIKFLHPAPQKYNRFKPIRNKTKGDEIHPNKPNLSQKPIVHKRIRERKQNRISAHTASKGNLPESALASLSLLCSLSSLSSLCSPLRFKQE